MAGWLRSDGPLQPAIAQDWRIPKSPFFRAACVAVEFGFVFILVLSGERYPNGPLKSRLRAMPAGCVGALASASRHHRREHRATESVGGPCRCNVSEWGVDRIWTSLRVGFSCRLRTVGLSTAVPRHAIFRVKPVSAQSVRFARRLPKRLDLRFQRSCGRYIDQGSMALLGGSLPSLPKVLSYWQPFRAPASAEFSLPDVPHYRDEY